MYTLTCPSCNQTTRHAFVRINAVCRCDACERVYRIDRKHLQLPSLAEPPAETAADTALIADSPPPKDASSGSSITGLSGLSQLMEAEPAAKAKAKPVAAPPPGRRPAPSDPTQEIADLPDVGPPRPAPRPDAKSLHLRAVRMNKRRRQRRSIMLIVTALALLVGLVGIALLLTQRLSETTTIPEAVGDDSQIIEPISDPELVTP
jgi:hypothetical protein